MKTVKVLGIFFVVFWLLVLIGWAANRYLPDSASSPQTPAGTCRDYAAALSQAMFQHGYDDIEVTGAGQTLTFREVNGFFARETMSQSSKLYTMRNYGCTQVEFAGDGFHQEYEIGTPQNPTVLRIQ